MLPGPMQADPLEIPSFPFPAALELCLQHMETLSALLSQLNRLSVQLELLNSTSTDTHSVPTEWNQWYFQVVNAALSSASQTHCQLRTLLLVTQSSTQAEPT